MIDRWQRLAVNVSVEDLVSANERVQLENTSRRVSKDLLNECTCE